MTTIMAGTMETSSKQLKQILLTIESMYVDLKTSNTPQTLEKKMTFYKKSNLLINEANNLIKKLESDINNVSIENTNANVSHIDTYLNLLSINNLNFDELINILAYLQSISNQYPDAVKIINDIDKEVLYEEIDIE